MKRPLPLDPAYIDAETTHLTPREFGALMRIALHFWQVAEVPRSAAAIAKVAGLSVEAAESMRSRLEPFFAAGGLFPILREAAVAKFERRARAGRLGGLRARSGRASTAQQVQA